LLSTIIFVFFFQPALLGGLQREFKSLAVAVKAACSAVLIWCVFSVARQDDQPSRGSFRGTRWICVFDVLVAFALFVEWIVWRCSGFGA